MERAKQLKAFLLWKGQPATFTTTVDLGSFLMTADGRKDTA